MDISTILSDKSIGSKHRTEVIAQYLTDKLISIDQLEEMASKSKDPVKATCIEAAEFASKDNPEIINETFFRYVSETLTSKAPRVKWESARVIANTAKLFPGILDTAITNLLTNTEHPGTVVRWSSATALVEIIKLKTAHNAELMHAVTAIIEREEKESIRKIYRSIM